MSIDLLICDSSFFTSLVKFKNITIEKLELERAQICDSILPQQHMKSIKNRPITSQIMPVILQGYQLNQSYSHLLMNDMVMWRKRRGIESKEKKTFITKSSSKDC